MIKFNPENKTFHLATKNSSYIMKVLENGMLTHWYYGSKIANDNMDYYNLFGFHNYAPSIISDGYLLSKDTALMEYPTFGDGDFSNPALCVENIDGRKVNDLIYKDFKILDTKLKLDGMPSFDCNIENVQTLEIYMKDSVTGYEVKLCYCVFEEEDAITRYAVITNILESPIKVSSAYSLSVDFQAEKFDLITLHGAWARERHINRQTLLEGMLSIESRRGASGHQHNPFAALVSPDTTEDFGKAYGFALAYSGNFKACAEVDQYGSTRLQLGINPFNFTYYLESGDSFTTPEAVMVYSENGLNGMSHCFHNMCRNHLGKSSDKNIKRPLLINSWEAMYFDMNEEKIKTFVEGCRGLGIDTFVLDDGWFGHRDCDDSSLGDWFVDKNKFPEGLHGVIDTCKKNGLDFGIWFEPEMISRKSKLFEKHPDWCIHINGKNPTESRQQLVLDMAKDEVVDCIFKQMSAFLDEYDVSYIKWDMNRNITDNGSDSLPPEKQGEHAHRYILGVYKLMERLTSAYPDILFEGCAGGGGRFDFGILYYMPQFWTSDDTDAIERLKIQYGTSIVYPPSVMTAHVSACPNHQTGRTTPFKTRGDVAQVCNFGYELDVNKLSDDEKAQIKKQTALHKKIESMIYDGEFYRLESPFDTDICCWELVSKDKSTAFAVFAAQKTTPHSTGIFLKLKGLKADAKYTVEPLNITLHGSTIMNAGLPVLKEYKDFTTATFLLKEI